MEILFDGEPILKGLLPVSLEELVPMLMKFAFEPLEC